MTYDFRSNQIQTNKIVASGSTGTGAKLLVYSEESEDKSNPNAGAINPNAFNTGSIGDDVFLYVSGTISSGSATDRISVVGGSMVISGNITIKGHLSSAYGGGGGVGLPSSTVNKTVALFNGTDGQTLTTSSYKQLDLPFLASNNATSSMLTDINKEEFITSGTYNYSVGDKVGGISGIRNNSIDYEYGYSNYFASGSHITHSILANSSSNYLIDIASNNSSSIMTVEMDSPITTSFNTTINSDGPAKQVTAVTSLLSTGSFDVLTEGVVAETKLRATSGDAASARTILDASDNVLNEASSIYTDSKKIILATSGSVIVSKTPNITNANIGTDVHMFVSGTSGGKDTVSGSVAVMGGDLVVSGNFLVLGSTTGSFAPSALTWGTPHTTDFTASIGEINLVTPSAGPIVVTLPTGTDDDEMALALAASDANDVTFSGETIFDAVLAGNYTYLRFGITYLRWNSLFGVWAVTSTARRSIYDINGDFRTVTTDANPTTIGQFTTSRSSQAINLRVSVWAFQTSGSGTEDCAKYVYEALVKRNSSDVQSVLTASYLSVYEDQTAWDSYLDVSSAGLIQIVVVGEANKTISWRCHAEISYHG